MFSISNLFKNFDDLNKEEIISTLGEAFWTEFLSNEVTKHITDNEWEKEYKGEYEIAPMSEFIDGKYKILGLDLKSIVQQRAYEFRDKFILEYITQLKHDFEANKTSEHARKMHLLDLIKIQLERLEWSEVESLFEELTKLN